MTVLSWSDIYMAAAFVANRVSLRYSGRFGDGVIPVYGIPTGGSLVATIVRGLLGHDRVRLLENPTPGCVLLDDVVDSGKTIQDIMSKDKAYMVDALYRKPYSPTTLAPDAIAIDGWIRFPWEHHGHGPRDAALRLLEFIGEDPTREGLAETPDRMLRALSEMTSGYRDDPKSILSKVFSDKCDEMVMVRDIPFWSLCEHHVLPFHGKVTVGYIPDEKVVGLSKIPRLVRCFSKRLQTQERMTHEIAGAIHENLRPRGVGVIVRGYHTCMAMRGVRSEGEMVTSALLGLMRQPAARAEFLSFKR